MVGSFPIDGPEQVAAAVARAREAQRGWDELGFEGPGTYVSGNALVGPTAHPGKPIESADHFADANSWGYRVAARLDYTNAIGPMNLFPYLSWQHDVNGISPTSRRTSAGSSLATAATRCSR